MELKLIEAQIEAILFTMGEAVELDRIAGAMTMMKKLQEK